MSWSRNCCPDTDAAPPEVAEPPAGDSWRTVEVPAERVEGWVDRFETRHGPLHWARESDAVRLAAPDGAVARLRLPDGPPQSCDRLGLSTAAAGFDTFGVVLVRRGGFAIGRVEGRTVSASRCGTRYVQGRTKAGGWSQQRYARRRARQADALIAEAAEAVRAVIGEAPLPLVCGGDRSLVREVLTRSGAEAWRLVRWLSVGEPRRSVLTDAVISARAARIDLNPLA